MDGTSLYVNLKTGPGGSGMPPGSVVGDIMQWNGSAWVAVQPGEIMNDVRKFLAVHAENQPVISVPAGFKLVSITFAASFGSTGVAQLSAATVPDGNNIFQARAIDVRNITYNPEGLTTIEINQAFSMTQSTRIYLTTGTTDDTWNGIVFDLYIVLKALK
jgi:hypothetical protein